MSVMDDIVGAIYRKDRPLLDTLLTPDTVNAFDKHGRTPLMHAVLAEDADSEVVGYLIERGANPNTPDTVQKWTALHFAARDQKAQIVEALLDAGCAVDPVDVFGNTPLWRAVMVSQPDPLVISVLIKRGADASKKNNHGVSPIDLAEGQEDILQLLQG